ncbi:MAG: gas vesicle protein [Oscillochloris sp.]|jgi:gas vesicle structural protein|nr:gas vesicle protein [Oscillochloris sp.]
METSEWDATDVTILDLLDRALDKGVLLWGELTLSIADVDLVYVGLKALLCSVDTAERMREVAWNNLITAQRS